MIAMGLSCRPALLIAGEPATPLDLTTQAVILKLVKDPQTELGMAIMFITHHLGGLSQMTSNAVVMYIGKAVESSSVVALFANPPHPNIWIWKDISAIARRFRQKASPYTFPTGNTPSPAMR